MPLSDVLNVVWYPNSGMADITGHVSAIKIRRGRTGNLDAVRASSCTIVCKNGDHAGNAPWFTFADDNPINKGKSVTVTTPFGVPELWTGMVRKINFGLDRAPFIGDLVIESTDALGVDARSGWVWAETITDGDLSAFTQSAGYWVWSISYGTVQFNSMSTAPVTVPAVIDEDDPTQASWAVSVREAVQKALDVEVGSLSVAANGDTIVNGRYAVADDPAVDLTLSDTPGPGEWPYARGSLSFVDVYDEYRNTAICQGISKTPFDRSVGGSGYSSIEMLDLWCADDNWVKANADLLAALHAGVSTPWPQSVDLLLWPNTDANALAETVVAVSAELGHNTVAVEGTIPGGTQTTWLLTLEGVEHTISKTEWRCRLSFSSAAQQWQSAYDLTVGLVKTDTPGRGIDSGAIVGP